MSAPPAAAAFSQRVVFIRHGESENNTLLVALDGDRALFATKRSPDAPLTDRGVKQAQCVARRVAAEYADATMIMSSYMHRALRTADAVRAALSDVGNTCPVRVHRDLHEIGGHRGMNSDGDIVGTPGRTSADVQAEFPSFTLAEFDDCAGGWWKSTGKEDDAHGEARAHALVALLAQEAKSHNAGPIVVITHGDFFRYCMRALEQHGAVPAAQEPYQLSNTSVSEMLLCGRCNDDGVAWELGTVPVVNCSRHAHEVGVLDTTPYIVNI
jgi:broad specificity phosphatase PhoE